MSARYLSLTPFDLKLEKDIPKIFENLYVSYEGDVQMYCWEFKKCDSTEAKACPVYLSRIKNCWLVAGTLCGGVIQGNYARKIGNCNKCDFYIMVNEEQIKQHEEEFAKYMRYR